MNILGIILFNSWICGNINKLLFDFFDTLEKAFDSDVGFGGALEAFLYNPDVLKKRNSI